MEPEFCPFCGRFDVEEVGRAEASGRGYVEITYLCKNTHRWTLIQPQRKDQDARSNEARRD